ILVGHIFSSTFPEESTNFNGQHVNRIRIGQTTEAEVIQLLGTPKGRFIYPYLTDRETRGLGWYYAPPYRNEASRTVKMVVISVNVSGIVTDIEYEVRGPQ